MVFGGELVVKIYVKDAEVRISEDNNNSNNNNLLKQDYKIQLANNKIQMAWLTSWLVVG